MWLIDRWGVDFGEDQVVDYAELIKRQCQKHDIGIAEWARITGFSRTTVSNWVNQANYPRVIVKPKIDAAYNQVEEYFEQQDTTDVPDVTEMTEPLLKNGDYLLDARCGCSKLGVCGYFLRLGALL